MASHATTGINNLTCNIAIQSISYASKAPRAWSRGSFRRCQCDTGTKTTVDGREKMEWNMADVGDTHLGSIPTGSMRGLAGNDRSLLHFEVKAVGFGSSSKLHTAKWRSATQQKYLHNGSPTSPDVVQRAFDCSGAPLQSPH
jgi:hypothetical protein